MCRNLACFLILLMGSVGVRASSFDEAMELYNAGQYEPGREALVNFVQASPDNESAQDAAFLAAFCLYRLSDYAAFDQDVAAYRAQYPESEHCADLDFYSAMAPHNQGEWVEARGRLRAFIEQNPDSAQTADAAFYASMCLFRKGDYAAFRGETQAFRQQHSNAFYTGQLAYYVAMTHHAEEDYAAEEVALNRFLKDYPESSLIHDALFYLAFCSFYQQKYNDFRQQVEEFKTRYPDSSNIADLDFYLAAIPLYQNREATTSLTMEDYDEAIALLEPMVTTGTTELLDKQNTKLTLAQACLSKALALDFQGDTPEAQKCFDRGLELMQAYRSELNLYREAHPELSAEKQRQLQMLYLESLSMEFDFEKLEYEAAMDIADNMNTPTSDTLRLCWDYYWLGISRVRIVPRGSNIILQTPPDLPGAAQAFDVILNTDLSSLDPFCYLTTLALCWRAHVAQEMDDLDRARECVVELRDEMPPGKWRTIGLGRFSLLLE